MPKLFSSIFKFFLFFMLSNKEKSATIGSWIKDEFRNDRSLGFVVSIDESTNMMLVRFPKQRKDT